MHENKHTQLWKYQNFSQHYYNLGTACRVHHKFWDAVIMVVKPYMINFCICSYNFFHSKVQDISANLVLCIYTKVYEKEKLTKNLWSNANRMTGVD